MNMIKIKNPTGNSWINLPGIPGKSAYKIATENGYTGTETEFGTNLNSLASTDLLGIINKTDEQLNTAIKGINSSSFINIEKFGVKGDGTIPVEENTLAFKSAFEYAKTNGHVNLYIPNGVYELNNYITIYSNTFVFMDNNTIIKKSASSKSLYKLFVNGILGESNFTGYDGNKNIIFFGGIIDLNYPNTELSSGGLTAFDLAHSDNIHFENVIIKNGQNGHYFQVTANNNVRFINCKFLDQNHTDTSSVNYEIIQIETITEAAFPSFGAYDNTISKNIIIRGCEFKNVIRTIGNHSFPKDTTEAPTHYCSDIIIENNIFENVVDEGLSLRAYDNFKIYDNKFINIGSFAVRIDYCKNGIVSNNITNNIYKSGIMISNSNNIKFNSNNWLETCESVDDKYSILRVTDCDLLFFTNETCKGTNVTHAYAYLQSGTNTNIFKTDCYLQPGTSG